MLDRTQMASRTSERLGYESTNLIKNPRTKIWVNFFDCVAGLLPRNSSMGRETNGNRCVQCGFRTSQLFVLYSPGNMHLMKCDNCKSVADEYIECEAMIVLVDLILHKRQAYRHLLYNQFDRNRLSRKDLMWKLGLSFLLLDACIQFGWEVSTCGMSCPPRSLLLKSYFFFGTCISLDSVP